MKLEDKLRSDVSSKKLQPPPSALQGVTKGRVGELCARANERGERVFVHRCGWEEVPAVVCCSAKVQEISDPYQSNVFVTFADAMPLSDRPQVTPVKGQNYYLV